METVYLDAINADWPKQRKRLRSSAQFDLGKTEGEGRWITIGGIEGNDGKKHGGSPVFIRNGRIEKGASSLVGKKIDQLQESGSDFKARGSRELEQAASRGEYDTAKFKSQEHAVQHWQKSAHHHEMNASREAARREWGGRARKARINPNHLHQLAAEIKEHDKEFAQDRTKMLHDARQKSQKMFGQDLKSLVLRSGREENLDPANLKGFDVIASSIASSYPEQFRGHEESAPQRLYDLLLEGNPQPMSEDEAYRHAFENLEEARHQRKQLEDAPFSLDAQTVPQPPQGPEPGVDTIVP